MVKGGDSVDYLLEPVELGSELSDLFADAAGSVTCDVGLACKKGTVNL